MFLRFCQDQTQNSIREVSIREAKLKGGVYSQSRRLVPGVGVEPTRSVSFGGF